MNKKTKVLSIFFTAMLLIFFCMNAAYSDAPGVPDPGKRVPARTSKHVNVKKKAVQAKKIPKPVKVETAKPEREQNANINPLNKAIFFIKQERYKKALPYILCAAKEQPQNADVWFWFGIWSDKTGNFSNAQKYFTKALEIDHNYPALNRIVIYPGDPYGKNPLWDSIRPPRIETIYPINEISAAAYDSPESLREFIPDVPAYQPPAP